jgi:HAD superfamily hydrolase (TIGR01662 family)
MKKAVIFDFDGVIANTISLDFRIYKEITKKLRKPFPSSWKGLGELTSGTFKELNKNLGIRKKEELSEAERIYKELRRKWGKEARLFPNVREVIAILKKKGFKIGIISNNYREFVNDFLERTGIEKYIDCFVGHGDAKKLKPNPEILLLCMKRLETKPEDTIFIGDMEVDVEAGRKAKVSKVIAVTWGWHSRKRLERMKPDAVIDRPEEILKFL